MNADENLTVFVIVTVPGGVTDGEESDVDLLAEAVTGTGAPGTVFAGQGVDRGDAIVGSNGASANVTGSLLAGITSVDLIKSATVADPFGGTSAVPGSIVSYTITANVSGTGSVSDLVVTDTFPTGTSYSAGTLELDFSSLSDADDGDAGEASSTGISVDLGTVSGAPARPSPLMLPSTNLFSDRARIMKFINKFFAIALVIMTGAVTVSAANAQEQSITLVGDVKLVKVSLDDGGETTTELVEPDTIVPGDKLIFTTAYKNVSGETVENFIVTNPLPKPVRLAGDADSDLDLSVDGGTTWGKLGELRVTNGDGTVRAATHADVTHVRWTLATVAPGESGNLEYPAIIR